MNHAAGPEGIRENCGLFGVFGAPNAAELTYLGLFAQQHRGQESAGIASVQGRSLVHHKGMGLVQDVFEPDTLHRLRSHAAIGHVRYSTTGDSNLANAQPIVVETSRGMIAVAHNGNLVNSGALRREVEKQGLFFPIFHTTTDTEVLLYTAARAGDFEKGLRRAACAASGAYCLLFLTPGRMAAVRDPHGFRPLALGRRGTAWCVASETCALDMTGFKYQRDVEPGEIVILDRKGLRSERFLPAEDHRPAHCLFEHVYFARPDSRVYGELVQSVRHRLGRRLARQHPVKADFVTPVPDSGVYAALGYAAEAGIPFEMAYVRNHYVGRTFIQPRPELRASGVMMKLAVIRDLVNGKSVVVVDDSIIRGTTSKSRIRLLREAGAREIHLRISCPPTRFPCYYGIDFPTGTELIASRMDVDGIRRYVEADTLAYLGLEGLLEAAGGTPERYCSACWTGKYPVAPEDAMDKAKHERKPETVRLRSGE